MKRNIFNGLLSFLVAFSMLLGTTGLALAQTPTPPGQSGSMPNTGQMPPMNSITAADRKAAAERAANKLSAAATNQTKLIPTPGGVPDYFGIYPNYANSQLPELDLSGNVIPGTGIRKFVDSLAGLGIGNANDLGQYIPVAIPDQTTYPGSDYYEINLVQYTEQLHKDLPPTTLRGYVQVNTSDPTVSKPNYLGPMIVAQSDRPVRVKFTNTLPTGSGGNLFIPVDTTAMGAGTGPDESVTSIQVTNGGTGYTNASVGISGNGTGAAATATIQAGVITAIVVTSGGSGYTDTPTVTITGDGSGATANAFIGGLTSILVTNGGSGYTTAPAVSFMYGGGVNAAATAYISGLTGLTLTNGGSGYTSAPTVAISDTTGTGATATAAITTGVVTNISIVSGGSGYTTPPVIDIVGDGSGATAVATLTGGAVSGITITNGGSGYTTAPTVNITGDGTGASATATISGVVSGITLTNGGSGYSSTPTVNISGGGGSGATATAITAVGVVTSVVITNQGSLFTSVPMVMFTGGGGSGASATATIGAAGDLYTQNRASLHLHGGVTPWISDGTPSQWITPAGETTSYPKGVSVQNVPDMPDPGPGAETIFYTNQQSARLMFYHDHAYGITRLNVYAGEAAGYILRDATEKKLIDNGILPANEIPLVIQDKTFVPKATQLAAEDPTWDTAQYGGQGNLWFPHVYMPNQNPGDQAGVNAMGRWDYGPWFWPPYATLMHPPVANPYFVAGGAETATIPGTPNPSLVPEGFMDTPLINGTAYPYLDVQPTSYRFRILNASDDRTWNLQMYVAKSNGAMWDAKTGALLDPNAGEVPMVPAVAHPGDPTWPSTWPTDGRDGGVPNPQAAGPKFIQIGTEGGVLPAPVVLDNQPVNYNYNRRDIVVLNVSDKTLMLGPAERADVIVDFSQYAGKTLILYNDSPAPVPAFDPRYDYYTGDPDQTSTGGAPTTLPGYGPNTRTVMQIRVAPLKTYMPLVIQKNSLKAAASGNTMDSAAPSANFKTVSVQAQSSADVKFAFGAGQKKLGDAYDVNVLKDAFATTADHVGAFAASQEPILVPQAAYDSAYNANYPSDAFVRIQDTQMTFTPAGSATPLTLDLKPKAIQELFETDYGRMNATLGVELPYTNVTIQTTIPYGYIDPPTEMINDSITPLSPVAGDGTQIWKITHNGVDTHAIHFHLFNVQIINRVGWDGAIRPPDPNELGWKETVRMNPLEDAIVALRPVAPKLPFGIPDSIHAYDVTRPIGSTMGFTNVDPTTGNPVTVVNKLINFGWEYVWHCHLLGHEENDMMRPILFTFTSALPDAPVLTSDVSGSTVAAPQVSLHWSDATPPATNLGNPKNEIGFRIERSTGAGSPDFSVIATSLANQTGFTDTTVVSGSTYNYRVTAFNEAGASTSNVEVQVP